MAQPLPALPIHDPRKPTAVVILGNKLTESTDFLAPYAVLAASGAFNLYAVAPQRRVAPLFPGDLRLPAELGVLPHYSFAEYDQRISATPDLLVIPFIPFTDNTFGHAADAAIPAWIRQHVGAHTTILSICGGAKAVAEAGLLDGRRATSYHQVLPLVERSHPTVHWVHGARWVEDGNVISSAGITASIDATLHTLERLFERTVAESVARELNYPLTRFLDVPRNTPVAFTPLPLLPNLYRFGVEGMGVALYEGMGELALASVLDTYPRSYTTRMHTLAPMQAFIRTQHGLELVARWNFENAPRMARMLISGQPSPSTVAVFTQWAQEKQGVSVEPLHAKGGFAYDLNLQDLARHQGRAIAIAAATALEYPTALLELEGMAWPFNLLIRPLVLGLLGLVTILWFEARLAGRRAGAL